eukprot:11183767-Lingulodinium_polyedra.AAC.1
MVRANQTLHLLYGVFSFPVGLLVVLLRGTFGDDVPFESVLDELCHRSDGKLLVALEDQAIVPGLAEVL